ncbi:YcxB family protein [Qiania dongpingensis]|uniref:YcxB family protein n=1 Tax=Qiania dongpingensis TaxID=2763669 RepID=A0A7G9G758_9FIRM|nr:YcxB family protein [Qiania dongpingensis]QNM06640.1 YcxB family protein [Qiania dongpingensis]
MEKIRVTTEIKPKYLFRFQVYHTYFGLTGVLLVLLSVMALVDLIGNFGSMAVWAKIFCIFILIWGLVLNPLNLYYKSKKQAASTELFQHPIDVEISKDGLGIFQGDKGGLVEWKDITKIVILKNVVLFYMGKVRAHLLPLDQNPEQADDVVELIRKSAKGRRVIVHRRKRRKRKSA